MEKMPLSSLGAVMDGAPPVWAILVDAGSFGLVAFVVWYVFRSLIPKLLDQFNSGIEQQRTKYHEMLSMQRSDYLSALAREREIFTVTLERDHEAWVAALESNQNILNVNNESIKSIIKALDRLTTTIIYHDAAVRGLEPEKVESKSDLAKRVGLRRGEENE